jgi:hypothetical protein
MQSLGKGLIRKMGNQLEETVQYQFRLGDDAFPLNDLLGQTIKLHYFGAIFCLECGRKTNKSFSQGYCYPCFQKLASCDLCIMSPEKCHYDQGTCREPEWGEEFCMQPHIVYLANSSSLKVGITRINQVPTRWIDQGAIQAIPILRVQTRQQSGLVEVAFKSEVSDRTSWQAMLKNLAEPMDLAAKRDELFETLDNPLKELEDRFGIQAIQRLSDGKEEQINYPVLNYPEKVKSVNFDKQPLVEGQLQGIKGQYLIFDIGVINIRKFTSYEVEFFA